RSPERSLGSRSLSRSPSCSRCHVPPQERSSRARCVHSSPDERRKGMSVVVRGLAGLKGLAGSELEPSRWLTMSQDRIQTFADATGDHQWIHVDVERARTGPFGGTIAHGYLTLAIIIPLWTEMVQIEGIGMAINYGLN